MWLELELDYVVIKSSDRDKWLVTVKGLPGGGKSLTTLKCLVGYSSIFKVVYSAPLRSLRNYWGKRFGMRIVRSRDEVCPIIGNISEDDVLTYLIKCAKACANCNAFYCEFKELFKNFIRSSRGLFALTHKMLMILYLASPEAFKNTILIIDEADSLFEQWSIVCELDKLRCLYKSGDSITRKVVKRLAENCLVYGKWVYFKPVVPLARVTFLVSATLIEELLDLMPIPSLPRRTIYIKSEFKDDIAWNYRILKWKERDLWFPKVLNLIERYCSSRVGIASRNYALTRMIHEHLEASFKVTSDYYHRKPKDAEVIIWTTRGKWYRGVSLPDTDTIFCFYQYPLEVYEEPINPVIMKVFVEKDIEYFKLLNDATNVQSYFRSNRVRNKKHLIVFLDARGYHAFNEVFPYKWVSGCTRRVVTI